MRLPVYTRPFIKLNLFNYITLHFTCCHFADTFLKVTFKVLFFNNIQGLSKGRLPSNFVEGNFLKGQVKKAQKCEI